MPPLFNRQKQVTAANDDIGSGDMKPEATITAVSSDIEGDIEMGTFVAASAATVPSSASAAASSKNILYCQPIKGTTSDKAARKKADDSSNDMNTMLLAYRLVMDSRSSLPSSNAQAKCRRQMLK